MQLTDIDFGHIQHLSEILDENLINQSGESLLVGTEFELGIFKIKVNNAIKTYENDLIKL